MEFIILLLWTIFHPIKNMQMALHLKKNNHHAIIDMVNFRFDCWCEDCGEIFNDEVR